MKTILSKKNILTLAIVLLLSLLAYTAGQAVEDEDSGVWYSVLPPLLAVCFAIASGQILVSLVLAVLIGGLLVAVPADPLSIAAWGNGIDSGFGFVGGTLSDSFNQQLLIFVILVLAMISVAIVSGGLHAVVLWLSKFARGRRSAKFVTFLLGILVFIDDYANTMIVGASMRPVTDSFRVSREKLSFIVDATSAPVAGLAVVSTWVGYEVGLFTEAANSLGIDQTGYSMLFDALFFRFYCVLMIVFVFLNVVFGKDYGPMRAAELRVAETGRVAEEDAVPMTSETFSAASPDPRATTRIITGLIPVGSLFIILLGGIWLDGGGLDRLSESPSALFSFGTWREVISASENSVKILAYGAGISLLIAVVCARLFAHLDMRTIRNAAWSGAKSSMLPCFILTMAWSLKLACDELGTGPFLVAAVGNTLPAYLFPALIFVIAAITSFATGTSYGTMAILMPTAVPIAFALDGNVYGPVTIVTLASILDGSIFGDHCSPISDTTIMSSIASSADHMHHVRTQLPYSLTVGTLALVCGYIPAGLGVPSWIGFMIAIGAMLGLYILLPKPDTVPARAVAEV